MDVVPAGGPIPETYGRLRRGLNLLVRVFFRRIEVVGLENIPADRGGVLVAWHPNGLVDPALILSVFPHQVIFGARHGLFSIPILGRFMKAIGTVPMYRRQDLPGDTVDAQRNRNEASLDALADRIAQGSFSALFPEGTSHDAPFLRELKTGAARLYYRARTRTTAGLPAPVVIPVGLHYDHKRVFRSSALVVFHPPLVLPPELDVTPGPDADPEEVRGLAHGLTERIEPELKAAILETESWELHRLFHRARKLIRAERAFRAGASPGGASMDERIAGLARIWVAYRELVKKAPEAVAAYKRRVERYDADLRSLGVEDHELDDPPPMKKGLAWLFPTLQVISVFLLLPPLLVVGYIVNLPPTLIVSAAARMLGKEEKDIASIKVLGGLVWFPVTWSLWGWLAVWQADRVRAVLPWLPDSSLAVGAMAWALSIAGAIVMVLYLPLALVTVRALRVRFTRGLRTRTLARLKHERANLCDELLALAAGIELPGTVGKDGRVIRTATH